MRHTEINRSVSLKVDEGSQKPTMTMSSYNVGGTKIGYSQAQFLTERRNTGRKSKRLKKDSPYKHRQSMAEIPVEAMDAMRHLPKLIYGCVPRSSEFGGDERPEQDADLTVSELATSLRMIIKRLLESQQDSKKSNRELILDIFMNFDMANEDGTHNGLISFTEFSSCMNELFHLSFQEATLAELFMSIDTDMSKQISFQEFLDFFTFRSPLSTFNLPTPETVTCVAFSRDGRYCAYGGMYFVHVLESRTKKYIFKKEFKEVQSIALSSRGAWLIVGGWASSAIELFELAQFMDEDDEFVGVESVVPAGDTVSPKQASQKDPPTDSPAEESKASKNDARSLRSDSAFLFATHAARFTKNLKRKVAAKRAKKAKQAQEDGWRAIMPTRKFEMVGRISSLALSGDDAYLLAGGKKGVVRLFNAATAQVLCSINAPSEVKCVDVSRVPLLAAVFETPICGFKEKVFRKNELLSTHMFAVAGEENVQATVVCLNLTGSTHLPPNLATSLVPERRDLAEDGKNNLECSSLLGGVVERSLSFNNKVHVRLTRPSAAMLRAETREIIHDRGRSFGDSLSDLVFEFDAKSEHIRYASWGGSGGDNAPAAGTHVVVLVHSRLLVHAYDNKIVAGGNFHSVILTSFLVTCVRENDESRNALARQSSLTSLKAQKVKFGKHGKNLHNFSDAVSQFSKTLAASAFNEHTNGEGDRGLKVEGKSPYELFAGYLSDVHTFALEMKTTSEAVGLHGDTGRLAIGTSDGKVLIMSTSRNREEVLETFNFEQTITCLVLSKDGSKMAVCGSAGMVTVYDLITGSPNFHVVMPVRVSEVAFGGQDFNDSSCICFGGHNKRFDMVNYHVGQHMQSYPSRCTVRSVSLSANGRRMAVGRMNDSGPGSCKVIDLHGSHIFRRYESEKSVWSVDLSRDGEFVAYGGYDGWFRVIHLNSDEEKLAHHFEITEGAINFIWSVCFSDDMSRVAASSWTGEVIIWSMASFKPICKINRPGIRVFSIALSRDGSECLVGSRDGMAILYGLRHDEEVHEAEIIFCTQFPNRVYSVALNESHIALGGMHSSIHLYKRLGVTKHKHFDWEGQPKDGAEGTDVAAEGSHHYNHHFHFRLVAEFPVSNDQNSCVFSPDGLSLAAGGEDKCIRVWKIDDDEHELVLLLPRRHPVNEVCFSDSQMAFSVGNKALIYGDVNDHHHDVKISQVNPTWTHQPSFDVLIDILKSPEALAVVKKRHPQCLNMSCAPTGESLLQRCVRIYDHDILTALLENVQQIGLIRDNAGFTALDIALKWKKRKHVKTILRAVATGRVSTLPSSLEVISDAFERLSKTFPGLFLEFMKTMPLDEASGMLSDTEGTLVFPSGIFNQYVRGTELRSEPRNLWSFVFQTQREIMSPGIRVEVEAVRVPFERFVGSYEDVSTSPFHLVFDAAQRLNRYEAFENGMMKAAIQFKWNQYARWYFLYQGGIFFFHLVLSVVFSLVGSRAITIENCSNQKLYSELLKGDLSEECSDPKLVRSSIVFPFSFLMSLHFLLVELRQCQQEGVKLYFTGEVWNYIDLLGFGFGLIGHLSWFAARDGSKLAYYWARFFLGFSCLLMAWKVMYFFRAFERGGSLVRLLIEIIKSMGPYLAVLLFFLASFAVALLVLNEEALPYILVFNYKEWCQGPDFQADINFITDDQLQECACPEEGCAIFQLFLEYLQFMATTVVYGDPSNFYLFGVSPTRSNQIIYNLAFFILQIILLNLVIAVMGATYERVEANSVKNTLYERAAVITEVERIHMPQAKKNAGRLTRIRRRLTNCFAWSRGAFFTGSKGAVHPQSTGNMKTASEDADVQNFPNWLHVLRRKKDWKSRTIIGADNKDPAAIKVEDNSSTVGLKTVSSATHDVQDSLDEIGSQLVDVHKSIQKLNRKHKKDVRELRDMVQTLILRQQGPQNLAHSQKS